MNLKKKQFENKICDYTIDLQWKHCIQLIYTENVGDIFLCVWPKI